MVLANLGLALQQRGDHAAARGRFEESLAVRRELDDRWGVAWSTTDVADAARAEGDLSGAWRGYAESLAMMRQLGERSGVARALECCAALAAATERLEVAVQLAGAAEALRDASGLALPADWATEQRRWLDRVRTELGEGAFARGWGIGRAMTLDMAVELVLST